MKDQLTKGRASKGNLENMAAKLRIEKEQKLHGGASAQELLNAQYPTPAKDNINLNDYFSDSENVPQGYYDDGKGNIVFAPNVKSLKDLDDLGIKGAYIGEVFYDEDSATYYDENGVVHYNMVLDWGNMEYEWNFSKWLSNLDFEGDTVDKIGSGFVLVGSGQTTKSGNRSEHPEDDIYIPEEVINALTGIAGVGKKNFKGNGKTNVTVKRSNTTSKVNAKVKKFQKGMSDAKKIKKYITALSSIKTLNKNTPEKTISKSTKAVNYTIHLDTKEIDSIKTIVNFKGTEEEVNKKIDSTIQNSKEQRRTSLNWFK